MAQFQLNKQATVRTKLTELLRIKVIVKLKELGEVLEPGELTGTPFDRPLDFSQYSGELYCLGQTPMNISSEAVRFHSHCRNCSGKLGTRL